MRSLHVGHTPVRRSSCESEPMHQERVGGNCGFFSIWGMKRATPVGVSGSGIGAQATCTRTRLASIGILRLSRSMPSNRSVRNSRCRWGVRQNGCERVLLVGSGEMYVLRSCQRRVGALLEPVVASWWMKSRP